MFSKAYRWFKKILGVLFPTKYPLTFFATISGIFDGTHLRKWMRCLLFCNTERHIADSARLNAWSVPEAPSIHGFVETKDNVYHVPNL